MMDIFFKKAIVIAGILLIIFICWLFSEKRKEFPYRIVIWGIILQIVIAALFLNFPPGVAIFQGFGKFISNFLDFSKNGVNFLFGNIIKPDKSEIFGFQVALIISATIIFFASIVSLLYHFGIMQRIVYAIAWLMQKTMRTSGIESLSAASNIFLGQTEAPLLIRAYLPIASRSEINSIMVGGFATIAGGVMAAYIQMGINAETLIIASLISAPGGLLLSKIVLPPESNSVSLKDINIGGPRIHKNSIEAIYAGASDGMKLSLNVIAMLIAFIAIIAVIDASLNQLSVWASQIGWNFIPKSLNQLFGSVFQLFAYIVNIPMNEASTYGGLIGSKIAMNEFIAYAELSELISNGQISERTAKLATIALCGFANFSSIAIQIGGLGALVPEKRPIIASLGIKAMLIGALANLLTTSIAALFI